MHRKQVYITFLVVIQIGGGIVAAFAKIPDFTASDLGQKIGVILRLHIGNATLAEKKANWIDFDASPTLSGSDLSKELLEYVIRVAEGEQTKNEANKYEEISIFKDGVTL